MGDIAEFFEVGEDAQPPPLTHARLEPVDESYVAKSFAAVAGAGESDEVYRTDSFGGVPQVEAVYADEDDEDDDDRPVPMDID